MTNTEPLHLDSSLYRSVFEFAGDTIIICSEEGIVIECNQTAIDMFVCTREQLIGTTPMDWSPELQPNGRSSAEMAANVFTEARTNGIVRFEWENICANGSPIVVDVIVRFKYVKDKAIFIVISRDITQRKEGEERFRFVLEGAELGYWDWDIVTGEVKRNARWAEMLGYTEQELENTTRQWIDFIHLEDREKAWKSVENTLTGASSAHKLEYRMLHKDGSIRWILDQANVVRRDKNGKPIRMSGTHLDITSRKEIEEQITQLAFYDSLTGLHNRRNLLDKLHYSIVLNHREGKRFAVIMMDLDKFKAVNDTLGHAAGDELLKQVAVRITLCLRESDVVARLGGDEFVIILENINGVDDVERVTTKIIEDLAIPFKLSSGAIAQIGASIGISFYPCHGNTPETLIDSADSALYQAKHKGGCCFSHC